MLTVEVYLKDIRKIQFSKVLNLIQLYYISLYSIWLVYSRKIYYNYVCFKVMVIYSLEHIYTAKFVNAVKSVQSKTNLQRYQSNKTYFIKFMFYSYRQIFMSSKYTPIK